MLWLAPLLLAVSVLAVGSANPPPDVLALQQGACAASPG